MNSMTIEQIKAMVESIAERKEKAISCGENIASIGVIKPMITKRHGGGYSIVFNTPIGDVLLRSVRQSERRFASIDSAMDAVNQCGLNGAEIFRFGNK